MITSTKTSKNVPFTEIKYPCVMENAEKDTIVLFNAKGKGITLYSDYYGIGYYSASWCVTDFTPFIGDVTIRTTIQENG